MTFRNAMRVTVLLVLILQGCENGTSPIDDAACLKFSSALAIKDRMEQAVSVFNVGEEVRFELQVTNNDSSQQTLYASSSCSAAVFEVADSARQKAWGSADGIACFAMVMPHTFAPGETVTYTANWLQQRSGAAPAQVPPDTYSVAAIGGQFTANSAGASSECRATLSKTGTFTIR